MAAKGVEGGMEWEVGVNRCKLLYTEKNIKEKKSMYIYITLL